MRKTLLLLICMLTITTSVSAQNIWQKRIPYSSLTASFCQLTTDGEHYFISGSRSFAQVDQLGMITGIFKQDPITPFWVSVKKKYDATTGHTYFWVIHRDTSPYLNYSFAEYRPGIGMVGKKTFIDSLTSVSWRRPQIVDLDDSTVVVFGKSFYRQIKHSAANGFSEEWVKPLNLLVTAAILHGDTFVVADETGLVTALDINGNPVWSQNHALGIRSLAATGDGFIGCGRTPDNKAGVIKLSFSGTETWFTTTSDADYYNIIPASDGGFVATGVSDSSKICLIKFNAAGEQIWKQIYSNGTGFGVFEAPDGGYVLAGRGNSSFYLIKTNAGGLTAPIEEAQITGRQVSTNSIQATLLPRSTIFFDGNDAQFISLADTNAATIFTFSPQIGGYDPNNVLHLAAEEYGAGGDKDFRPGIAQSPARDFNRVWAADRAQIAQLRRDFLMDNTLDGPAPYDLLTWPAKGNPHLKYNLDFTPVTTDPDLFPAPFEDANNDGLYNVYDGDYPRIKGDRIAWWAMTDSTEHTMSHGNVLGADLLISAFAFDCPQSGMVDKSLFLDFDVINRSATSYHNTYMGFYTDFDLGCYTDDYVGTMPDVNSFYVYNQDALDYFCDQGVPGFGEEIPVQTATFINKTLNHTTTYYYYSTLGQSFGPEFPGEYYNTLQGKWGGGAPLTEGGTGYNPGSTNYTDYIFPGNPADPQGWSMCTESFSFADREMFGSHGPFEFGAGDTFNIQIAFTLHPDIPHPCPDIFSFVKPAVAQISQWKNEGALDAVVDLGQVIKLPTGQSATLDAGNSGATYLWSTGETTQVITVEQPGEYSVSVTLPTGCQVEDHVLVDLSAKAPHAPAVPAWTIQPNPAKDFVYVECPDCPEGNVQVILRNAQGMASINIQGQNRQFRVNTQHLPQGFYWMELWQEGRFFGSKKLVVAGR